VQMLAGVQAPVLPTQPLSIQEVGPGQMHSDTGAGQPVDSLSVQGVGGTAVAEQCARAGLDAEGPLGAAGAGAFA
jgi:hypothetical protein